MEIIILPSPAEVGRLAARKIAQLITAQAGRGDRAGHRVLTAGDLRRAGRARCAAARWTPAGCAAFALDEYVGIPADHPRVVRAR